MGKHGKTATGRVCMMLHHDPAWNAWDDLDPEDFDHGLYVIVRLDEGADPGVLYENVELRTSPGESE